jgi:hypothetical protein
MISFVHAASDFKMECSHYLLAALSPESLVCYCTAVLEQANTDSVASLGVSDGGCCLDKQLIGPNDDTLDVFF